MGVRYHMRCLMCGIMRPYADLYNHTEKAYDPLHMTQTLGGRGQCKWEPRAVTLDEAHQLRDRLRTALARLEAELAELE